MVCLGRPYHITSNFLNAVFHKFYLVHSSILCPICPICERLFPPIHKKSSGLFLYIKQIQTEILMFYRNNFVGQVTEYYIVCIANFKKFLVSRQHLVKAIHDASQPKFTCSNSTMKGTRKSCEIYRNARMTPMTLFWCFYCYFDHISHLFLVFLWLTLSK